MLLLALYTVALKLRFKLEVPVLLIILTQLIVMGVRIFLSQDSIIIQNIIMVFGDVIFKASLYYFVFEMYYVAQRLDAPTHNEYQERIKWVKIKKIAVMFGLIVI